MKKIFYVMNYLFLSISLMLSQEAKEFNYFDEVKVTVTNSTDLERIDELVSINVKEIKNKSSNFNKDAFIVYLGDQAIPSQLYNDEFNCSIIFACNFKPNQTKEFSIKYLEEDIFRKQYKSRTYAELAMKLDAFYKDKKFNSDHFENFIKVIVPKIHTDHDALFKYEGPGWESEKVGYRFYLDWRNATDIFGKKVNDLVLHKVGNNDVIAKDIRIMRCKIGEWIFLRLAAL